MLFFKTARSGLFCLTKHRFDEHLLKGDAFAPAPIRQHKERAVARMTADFRRPFKRPSLTPKDKP
ncbi:MAG: hypothetical protein JJD98_20845 [Polaromonas sp.]|nr:hypothetical protein [Polaromonas sp.]